MKSSKSTYYPTVHTDLMDYYDVIGVMKMIAKKQKIDYNMKSNNMNNAKKRVLKANSRNYPKKVLGR